MGEPRECPINAGYMLYPCEMVVAMSAGRPYRGNGCVVSYKGEEGHGVHECIDDYAGYLPDMFHGGSELPEKAGIYKFSGDARVHMVGGSDEQITFHGEFTPIEIS